MIQSPTSTQQLRLHSLHVPSNIPPVSSRGPARLWTAEGQVAEKSRFWRNSLGGIKPTISLESSGKSKAGPFWMDGKNMKNMKKNNPTWKLKLETGKLVGII